MRRSPFNLLNIIGILLLCIAPPLLFSACENFLNGAEIKQEIEEQIYIANHESPVAKIEEPAFSGQGVAKNRAIVISFTQSMNPETLSEALSITDAQGKDLLPNFTTPVWSNDDKLVTIPANEKNLIDLQGKKAMDIYVTLSKSCRTRDRLPIKDEVRHNYRISDNVDNTAPLLVAARGELPPSYIGREASSETILLSDEDFTAETEVSIIQTNHIRSKVDFYIEGNDNGGDVYAHFKYSRVFDVSGEAVSEAATDKREKLTFIKENGISYDTVCLDISESTAKDGLYKVTVTVSDASNIDSEDSKVYYLLRDTTLANSTSGMIWFETPQFRNDLEPGDWYWQDGEQVPVSITDFDSQIPTVSSIERYMQTFKMLYMVDDVYYISNFNATNRFKQKSGDLSYFVSWGTSENSMSEPVQIIGYDDETDYTNVLGFEGKYFYLPDSYKTFRDANLQNDIYLRVFMYDSVGNYNTINTLVPKQIDFYNYEVLPGDTDGKKKIKLNYLDLSNMGRAASQQLAVFPGTNAYVLYRIFYGRLEDGVNEREMELRRNTVKPFKDDRSSDISDNNILEVDSGSKYVFYIQPNYNMHADVNDAWTGQVFGPLYRIAVDTSEALSGSVTKPKFTLEKESAGVNSSMVNVTVTVTNPEAGVTYIPCYNYYYREDSYNHQTTNQDHIWKWSGWSVCNISSSESASKFTFQVENRLRAPFETEWRKPNEPEDVGWTNYHEEEAYFVSVKRASDVYGYPEVEAKIKILAIKGNSSAESDEEPIYFSERDDNIPPTVSKDVYRHDSKLSFDGHSFNFRNLVMEDEGHLSPSFQYYYMPYNSVWGDNLSVATPEEIEKSPGGFSSYTSNCYYDGYSDKADYWLDMSIPLNGIPDGRYMLFAKVSDTYGNFNYVTLGKADVGTFKNKLKVEHNPDNNHLVATLTTEAGEIFGRNMISIQGLDTNKGKWDVNGKYGFFNQLQNCEVIEGARRVLRYETPDAPGGINEFKKKNDAGGLVDLDANDMRFNHWGWYRLTVQGFNENLYDGTSGVNWKYGRPYHYDMEYDSRVNWSAWINNESAYDVCTEETVSNTVYVFIPPTKADDPGYYENEIKSAFFESTATPRSNKPFLVNIISANRDLGRDPDEWERRGKLIMTHYYNPFDTEHYTQFNETVAADDMFNSNEKGFLYYVAVVHFADGNMAISKTYTMQGM